MLLCVCVCVFMFIANYSFLYTDLSLEILFDFDDHLFIIYVGVMTNICLCNSAPQIKNPTYAPACVAFLNILFI